LRRAFARKVVIPEISKEDQARDVKLSDDRADAILDHLERFEYASRNYVILSILWHTGIRLGTLRAIDVDDWDS
jgi:integrase